MQAGITTRDLEYRPMGGYPGTFQDIAAGTDQLPQPAELHSLDIARAIAVGHSSGGHECRTLDCS